MPEDDERRRAFFAVSDGVLGAAVLLSLGVYGGNWLDTKFHTAPWLSVGLSILGGGLGLARMVMKASALDTKSTKTAPPAQSSTPKDSGKSDESKPHRMPYDDFSD